MRIILPLSRPGLLIATIFPITFSMNEVLYAVTYVGPREQRTVTVAIASTLIRGDIFYWGALMAAGLLVGLPLDPLPVLSRPLHPGTDGGRQQLLILVAARSWGGLWAPGVTASDLRDQSGSRKTQYATGA